MICQRYVFPFLCLAYGVSLPCALELKLKRRMASSNWNEFAFCNFHQLWWTHYSVFESVVHDNSMELNHSEYAARTMYECALSLGTMNYYYPFYRAGDLCLCAFRHFRKLPFFIDFACERNFAFFVFEDERLSRKYFTMRTSRPAKIGETVGAKTQ